MAGVTENLRKTQASSYSIQVDSDRKATEIKLFAVSSSPHMRAFHLAWLSLFACFFSTFSLAPLLPLIQKDLDLTASDVGRAGIAAFIGSIFSRLAMGPACDLVGPRIASATLSIITTPAVVYMCFIRSPVEFIIVRFLIGLSIANFVANQFWMSCMFSSCVVGLANGLAAGWANVGSGVTQLVMPVIYSLLMTRLRMPSSVAWRTAFVIPAVFQAVTAVMVLVFGQDLPDGNYATARKFSNTQQQRNRNGFNVLLKGLANYRGWILGLTYGFCFGVELTTDNVIARYFYDRFDLSIETSGAIASSFGLANIVSRPTGGYVSDRVGKRFGMRGRLWSLWVVQTVAGLLCVLLGRVNYSLWASMVVMCVFSFFVQAASGLTFGVVPFVSKRSMGVISGMTGSGGTVGAVVTQLLLFSGTKKMPTETSISLMGIMMLVCSLPITLIYFPQWGGMFCRPSSFHTPATDDDDDDEDYQLLNQNSL